MNSKKTITRIKIFFSLLASLLFVTYISPQMFVGNTTAFNPGFIARVKVIPYTALAYIRHPLNTEERANIIETSGIQTITADKDLNYTPISTGVYAAQHPTTGETIVKIDAGTEVEVKTIKMSDGREIKVYVPIR